MKIFKNFLFASLSLALFFASCKDEEVIENIKIASITATGTNLAGTAVTADLNTATAVKDIPLNAKINVAFSKAVDPVSITNNSIQITEGTSTTTVPGAVAGSGTTITFTPTGTFARGTLYTIKVTGIKGSDGAAFTDETRTFTTEGRAAVTVPKPESVIAYFSFDGKPDDVTKTYTTGDVVAITYGTDRFGQANSTASFDGDKSIIEINAADKMLANKDFTISFWMKSNSTGHVDAEGKPAGYFVFGLGAFKGFQFEIPANFSNCKLAQTYTLANGTFTSEDLWFPGDGKDKDKGGWRGWDFVADLTGSGGVASLIKDKWVHIICTYNATTKQGRMYINGELMKGQDFNLWPDADPKKTVAGVGYQGVIADVEPILAFGFIKSIDSKMWADTPWGDYAKPTSNHFKGDLDDVRVFKTFLTAAEAKTLYNSEKP
jgi:hypothetical protein